MNGAENQVIALAHDFCRDPGLGDATGHHIRCRTWRLQFSKRAKGGGKAAAEWKSVGGRSRDILRRAATRLLEIVDI